MTVVLETAPVAEAMLQAAQLPMHDRIEAAFSRYNTPEMQWRAVERTIGHESPPEDRAAHNECLLDLARDTGRPFPMLLKAVALDASMSKIHADLEAHPGHDMLYKPETIAEYRRIRTLVPEFFASGPWGLDYKGPYTEQIADTDDERISLFDGSLPERKLYFDAIRNMARAENLSADSLFTESYSFQFDHELEGAPRLAFYLMDRLGGGIPGQDPSKGPLVASMAPAILRDVLEVAIAAPDTLPESRVRAVTAFARLAKLTSCGGAEHNAPIEFLYGLPDDERTRYAEQLNELHDVTGKQLAELFPDVPPEDAMRNTRKLLADATFALQYYVEHGNAIDVVLPYYVPGSSIHIKEDNASQALHILKYGVDKLHRIVYHPALRAESEIAGDNVALFSLHTPDTPEPQASYCARSEASELYDDSYEFKGDITSRYRVRLENCDAIKLLNKDQTPDTLAIRMDADRWGIAMDIGAMADNPFRPGAEDIEVRIGRFLGFGNYLRTAATDSRTTWNHIRDMGDIFDGNVEAFRQTVVSRRNWIASRAGQASLVRDVCLAC